ncbi:MULTISPECIES: DUF6542 domain-containing protein [Actinomadura]|uniref:DUF6542 domain-containing protein n=1 Tax=Actinomadura TaxID=1988 RepID=UPI001BE48249|nr:MULTISPECIES: DUF6542 domain-containing protein [Actinomadura]MBT2213952.1 hypothetical protein [Actinomadura sp. NEAU-AAG7]
MSRSTVDDAPGGASPAPGGPVRGQRDGSARTSRAAKGSRARAKAAPAASSAPVALTARGGIVVMFGTGLVCALLARWLGVGLLAGGGFTIGCVLAAFATRPADLLTLVVSPPLAFFAATLTAVFLDTLGDGSLLRGMTVGVLTALAGTAPWLFFGTLLVLVICLFRGLPANVRELRGKLVRVRLFEKEDNEDPVRWDDSPSAGPERPGPERSGKERPLHHGDVD